jgi:hypothetical protein
VRLQSVLELLWGHERDYCSNRGHCRDRSTAVHLTYGVFSAGCSSLLSRNCNGVALFYTRRDKVWPHFLFPLVQRRGARGHLQRSGRNAVMDYSLNSFVSLVLTSIGKY